MIIRGTNSTERRLRRRRAAVGPCTDSACPLAVATRDRLVQRWFLIKSARYDRSGATLAAMPDARGYASDYSEKSSFYPGFRSADGFIFSALFFCLPPRVVDASFLSSPPSPLCACSSAFCSAYPGPQSFRVLGQRRCPFMRFSHSPVDCIPVAVLSPLDRSFFWPVESESPD